MTSNPHVTRRGALRVAGCAGAALCAHALGCGPVSTAGAGIQATVILELPQAEAPILDVDARVAIARVDDRVYAHSLLCTHEQCVVGFDDDDAVFDCPCHGARYATDGAMLAPPARRALDRHPLALTDEGGVQVDLTVRLRETDPGYDDAFVLAPA